MLGTLKGLIDGDLIYITSPSKKAGLYVARKVILKICKTVNLITNTLG